MSKLLETVNNPSPEVLSSMLDHAIKAQLSSAYSWDRYIRDMYFLAVSDILDELGE